MNVSIGGFNLVQLGERGTPALNHTLGDEELLLQKEYIKRFKKYNEDARKANRDFNSGYRGFNISFIPEDRGEPTDFGWAMKRIVQFMSAHFDFGGGAQRQTFFVNYGGWDHHENLHDNFGWRVDDVSFVPKAFCDALVEIDMLDNVVLFTASDFGRTLTTKGGGFDHGLGRQRNDPGRRSPG